MQKVYVLVGVIGATKSTWAKERAEQDPGILVVNKDAIRSMLFAGNYAYKNAVEPIVRHIAMVSTVTAINHQYDVIIDETHLTREKRTELIWQIRHHFGAQQIRMVAVVFPINSQCLERRLRDPRGLDAERWTKVFNDMCTAYEPVKNDEGFDEIIHVPQGQIQQQINPVFPVLQAVQEQNCLCREHKLPFLIPGNGCCYNCQKQIFDHEETRKSAGTRHITSCPWCAYSFAE